MPCPDVIAWIKQDPRFAGMPVRIDQGWIMTWYTNFLDPNVLPPQFGLLADFVARAGR